MLWHIGDDRNLFLKLKTISGDCHVLHTTPKSSLEKFRLTVAEMQQLRDLQRTDCKQDFSCLKWTI